MSRAALVWCLSLGLTSVTMAQGGAPANSGAARTLLTPVTAQEPGSDLTVYLMTIGQGSEVWERFGHNAIWIDDRRTGESVAYNWGLFDFNQPGFLPRFLAGTGKYWMDGFDANATIAYYAKQDRDVYVEELALTPRQRLEVRDFVRWNQQPENKFYRYDYYRDNCSTRVRDAIDRVLGGAIKAQTDSLITATTYRWHTKRLTQGDVPTYTGIMAALGEPADRPISVFQEAFLPMRLRESIRRVRVPDGHGGTTPLVKSDRQLVRSTKGAEPAKPSSFLLWYVVAGVVIAGFIAVFWTVGARGVRVMRGALAVSIATWGLLTGIVGTLLLLAWLATQHVFWYRNENLLLLNPLALVLVAIGPAALRRRAQPRYVRAAQVVAIALGAMSVMALAMKLLPWFPQQNAEILALTVPVNLAIAWVFFRRSALAPAAA